MRPFVSGARVGAVGILVAGAAWAQAPAAAEMPASGTHLVFVNTQLILPLAPGASAAQQTFQTELDAYRAELERLAAGIDSLLAAYRRQEALMDPTAKEQKQQEILQKQRDLQARQVQLEGQSETRRNELLEPILENVRDVVEQIRAENDYAIVFDIAESGVVAADPSLDITRAVLTKMGIDPDATASRTP